MKTRKSLFLLLPFLCLSSCGESKGIAFHSNVESDTFYTLYDDAYFLLDNASYHSEIALPSYASAMATIRSDCDYDSRSGFLTELWEKEGFSSFYISDSFKNRPELDSIGFAFAHKEIFSPDGPIDLLAVAIRSGTYDGEWANNITLGGEGDAKGMADSANAVYQSLLGYIEEKGYSGRMRFWLSGYSRGASVANCLSGMIIDALEESRFLPSIDSSKEDIYAYCFEPISCIYDLDGSRDIHGERYQGVKNVLNFNDLMPHIIPSGWGFSKFGEELYYPDRLTDIRFGFGVKEALIKNYRFSLGGHGYTPYTVDEWEFYDVGEATAKENNLPRESLFPSIGRFARSLCNKLSSIINRTFYFGGIEPGLRNLIATMLGYNEEVGSDLISPSGFLNVLSSYAFVRSVLFELQQGEAYAFANDLTFLLCEAFGKDKESYKAIHELCDDNLYLLFLIPILFRDRQDLALQFFSRDNLTKLFQCHYTQLNYSFTRSCDPRLFGKNACELNDGSYYLLHVGSPTSFNLEEARYGKIFSFSDGVMSSRVLSAERRNDGSLDIYLPKNGEYRYTLDSGSLSLSEVDPSGKESLLKENLPLNGSLSIRT